MRFLGQIFFLGCSDFSSACGAHGLPLSILSFFYCLLKGFSWDCIRLGFYTGTCTWCTEQIQPVDDTAEVFFYTFFLFWDAAIKNTILYISFYCSIHRESSSDNAAHRSTQIMAQPQNHEDFAFCRRFSSLEKIIPWDSIKYLLKKSSAKSSNLL